MTDPQGTVQREFDGLADDYESNRLAPWYMAHAELVVAHCPRIDAGAVLDIGCGTGYLLRRLAQQNPNIPMIGLDVAPRMISEAGRLAAEAGRDTLTFVNDDWEDLRDETREMLQARDFRVIVCANAFHYFDDPRRAVGDMFHLLRDGGILLLLERDKAGSLLTSLWGLLHRHLIRDQVEFYQTAELVNMLEEAGFRDVGVASRIKKYFWKGKMFTSIVLLQGHKKTQ